MFRVMQLYVRDLDPELYLWFARVWSYFPPSRIDGTTTTISRHSSVLRPANTKSLEKVLERPWLAACNATMPRFVPADPSDVSDGEGFAAATPAAGDNAAKNDDDEDSNAARRQFRIAYLPILVAATLGYYTDLQQRQQFSTSMDTAAASSGVEAIEDEKQPDAAAVPLMMMMMADEETCDEETLTREEEPVEASAAAADCCAAMEEEEEECIDLVDDSNNKEQEINLEFSLQQQPRPELSPVEEELEVTQPALQRHSVVKIAACTIDRNTYQVGLLSIDKFPDYIVASLGDVTVTYQPVCSKKNLENKTETEAPGERCCLMECDE